MEEELSLEVLVEEELSLEVLVEEELSLEVSVLVGDISSATFLLFFEPLFVASELISLITLVNVAKVRWY